jgi:hypothetical protein
MHLVQCMSTRIIIRVGLCAGRSEMSPNASGDEEVNHLSYKYHTPLGGTRVWDGSTINLTLTTPVHRWS